MLRLLLPQHLSVLPDCHQVGERERLAGLRAIGLREQIEGIVPYAIGSLELGRSQSVEGLMTFVEAKSATVESLEEQAIDSGGVLDDGTSFFGGEDNGEPGGAFGANGIDAAIEFLF